MKNVILTIAFVCSLTFGFAQDKGITITVTVDNLTSDKGKASFSLHTSETFMKGGGIMNASSEIKDGKAVITFINVKPGEYAILGMHDANENGRMDFRENGMPLESYGTSNNVMAFGPPQYEDAKFIVEDKDLELNLRF
jgi:uncharacterized protein (DUF2141 family)